MNPLRILVQKGDSDPSNLTVPQLKEILKRNDFSFRWNSTKTMLLLILKTHNIQLSEREAFFALKFETKEVARNL